MSLFAAPTRCAPHRGCEAPTIRIGADHDISELLRRRQTSLGLHAELELGRVAGWPGADAAHRRLDVLRLDDGDDVCQHQIQRHETVHVEPYTHRIFEPPEQRGIANAGNASQPIQHINSDIIADEQRGLLAAITVELEKFKDGRRSFAHRQAVALHLIRQTRDGLLNAVVDVDRIDVRVCSQLETHGQRVAAVVRAVGLHVDHFVHAHYRGLQRLGNGLFHHGSGCTRECS